MPFSPEGIAWAAAAAGAVRQSVGVDVDETGRLLPSPPKLLPFQRQGAPFGARLAAQAAPSSAAAAASGVPPRRPLAPLDANADVIRQALSAEVRALERRLRRADQQVKAQDQLIRDFCKLELARGGEQ